MRALAAEGDHRDIDDAGHVHGALSERYQQALARVDRLVSRNQDAVQRRADAGGERWILVVVADHGHVDTGGHGGDSAAERTSFISRWTTTGRLREWLAVVAPHELMDLILAERAPQS
ncbi:alkaline phosphatase family protein [Microbacterium sp. ASV81]|uniref:Alkaline phosphatase family protein n=1 Tax=Microbacterium capsulatum TaxID=3041921 RepID=A0ABU0XH42_9MICO|nr:alkaline phosphatase family protein [Microbacterium sp. ASV81]MDQ4214451.1 alkaline phosphatase family protein [Microbacterium sp. ASV81]